jgi:hypothetical protein
MRNWTSFNRWCLGAVITAAAFVPLVNVVVDPYDVFGTGLVRMASTANERVFKTRHLLDSPPYDVLLMGSSVTGVIDTRVLATRAYNASFFSATPGDILAILKALDRHGRLPKTLLIGLDPFMFTVPRPKAGQMRMPPEAGQATRWQFWRDYVFAGSAGAIAGKLIEARQTHPGVAFDQRYGHYRLARLDAERSIDAQSFAVKQVLMAEIPITASWWHAPAAEDLTKLRDWLAERPSIRVIAFVAPMRDSMRIALGEGGDAFFEAIRRTFAGGAVDLSLHAITANPLAWYENKHFTPEAGAMVLLDLTRTETRQAEAEAATPRGAAQPTPQS